MEINAIVVRSLIGGGLLALTMLLALCATVWVPSAYADELVANQGEIATIGGADGALLGLSSGGASDAAVNDISTYYCDYKNYLLFTGKVVTLEDLEVSLYRYDEAGNKVTLASSDYGDPAWYSKTQD